MHSLRHERPGNAPQRDAQPLAATADSPASPQGRSEALAGLHPQRLHATAAAWALGEALATLERLALDAAHDAVDGNRGTYEIAIPSQVFGRRTALGGHGDPTATTAIGAWAPSAPDPNARLLGDLLRQLDAAAGHLPGAPGMDPLTRIRHNIPAMRPHIAARTGQALRHLDRTARRHLHMPPDLVPLPDNPACPSCGLQMLQVHTADPARTVVCTADCHCRGEDCGCGMPVREVGALHIWVRSSAAPNLGGTGSKLGASA